MFNQKDIIIIIITLFLSYLLFGRNKPALEHMSASGANISAAALNKLDKFLADINETLTVKNLKVTGNVDGDLNITGNTTIGSNASIGSKLMVNTKKNVGNNALEIYLNKSGDPEYYFFNKNECGHFKNNTGHQPMKIAKLNVTDYAKIKRLDIPGQSGKTTHFNHGNSGTNFIRGHLTIDNNVDVSQNSHININGAVLEKKHAQILRGDINTFIYSVENQKYLQHKGVFNGNGKGRWERMRFLLR